MSVSCDFSELIRVFLFLNEKSKKIVLILKSTHVILKKNWTNQCAITCAFKNKIKINSNSQYNNHNSIEE